MYKKIFTGLDGSLWSDHAMTAAVSLAEGVDGAEIIGCHVYAAELHRERFEQMEPGLPDEYQEEEKLDYLRGTHESLITDGMVLISDSYLAPMVKLAETRNVKVLGSTPEGRNYVKVLEEVKKHQPDVVILGANGHGIVPEAKIGSITERVLLGRLSCDVLVMRTSWQFKNRPIVVGIDGSQASYLALKRALELAQVYKTTVEAVAVYDPFFHVSVFRVIADALPEKDQERFNFPAQEQLHDEIIDKGLEKLYKEGLDRGVLMAEEMGMTIKTEVLAGKVYPQIHHYAQMRNAGLIVMGTTGLHAEKESLIGSNIHNLARITETNLLVVAPPEQDLDVPELPKADEVPLKWTPEAEARMKKVPSFARSMARRSIEERAREAGVDTVTEEFVKKMRSFMNR